MRVHAITADGFRNLQPLSITPHPRFNVLHGDNGQGKTNLLEGVYVLATLRSFRTTRLDELVAFGSEAAALRARVEHRHMERIFGVEIGLRPPRKQALCDGKNARTSDYFGGFNVILFSPEDLRLPKGPPAGRRRFLDRAIWNTCPPYLDEVRLYDRILRSRNALLRAGPQKDRRPSEPPPPASPSALDPDLPPLDDAAQPAAAGLPDPSALLEIYDQRLATAGAQLFVRRRCYLELLAPRVATVFAAISGPDHVVDLHYAPALRPPSKGPSDVPGTAPLAPAPLAIDDAAQLSDRLLAQLTRDRRRDQLRGFTHSGPHADDIVFMLDGRPAELHASQGQTRALVLSLKIAEIQLLQAQLFDPPVLLLDDVSSELDSEKNGALFAFLRESESQVFITTTDPRYIRIGLSAADRQDFVVRGGAIAPSPAVEE